MNMKKYIAGILAVALLTGCGKFVRDELITMQNEIDQLYGTVNQLNQRLVGLQTVVQEMVDGGYIISVEPFTDEDGLTGYTLTFNNGSLVKLYHGVDGQDGQDAVGPAVSIKQDEETGRWYWTLEGEWLTTPDGERVLVDGTDGKTPTLKVEEGYWYLSWDGGENWEETGWKARGEDAYEIFSNIAVFDDHVELTLAADGSVLSLPRFITVDMELVLEGQDLDGNVLIAPGETLSIGFTLTGTGAETALLVAGTDGRFKTAIRQDTATTGAVEVTCPETFPEGGYIYITVNDSNGRSKARVIRFAPRNLRLLYGEGTHAVAAEGETGVAVTLESNCELEATCAFGEGVEPWITVKTEVVEGVVALTYDVAANTAEAERTAVIRLCPKDHPGFEMFTVTVKQAGAPAPSTGA